MYVFKRDGGAWAQRAYIKASNTAAYDHFGYRVALSGDTLAVTAVSESSSAVGVGGDQSDDSAPSSGAVYVFVRSGSDWAQQAYIKASNTQAVDVFGEGLSLSGDTMVVSAPWEDSAGAGVNNGNEDDNSLMTSGAAYVFVRVGTSWEQRAFIKASNAGMLDSFGTNAVVDGDTIVVSAYEEDSGASGIDGDQADDTAENAGAVYVFR